MLLLLVKLIVTPVLLGTATMVARRWGPRLAGWLVALPLTSGPLVVYVALEHGVSLGVDVGLAVVTGGFGLCAFIVIAAWCAPGRTALEGVGFATLGFVVSGLIVQLINPTSLLVVAVGVGLAILVAIRLVPDVAAGVRAPVSAPRWDLPVRMVVGTAIVVGLSTFAPVLGARISGLAATFPVYVATLVVFTHRQEGPEAAIALLRGVALGMYGWLGYFVILLLAMPTVGPLPAFAIATLGALAIHGIVLQMRRERLMPAISEVRL